MKWLYARIPDFTEADREAAYRQLSSSRKAHIDRFRLEQDRARSLTSELLVKKLLCTEFGLKDPVIARQPNGCPIVQGFDLHISIAHCDEMVVCAADTAPVGIDIERIRPIRFRAARHVCTQEELNYLFCGAQAPKDVELCTDEGTLLRFFEIWTAKEAYFKKEGTGITDLKSVNVLPLPRRVFRAGDYLIQIIHET